MQWYISFQVCIFIVNSIPYNTNSPEIPQWTWLKFGTETTIFGADSKSEAIFGLYNDIMLKLATFGNFH